VTLGVKVPMLLASFSPDARRYADFCATVAQHIRARGMLVSVELGSLSIASIARSAHLPLLVDEAWLYKSVKPSAEGGVNASVQVYRRDMFSFFEPLDQRFLAITAARAAKAGAAYVSADWSWQFFAYLTWTPVLDAEAYSQLTATFDDVVAAAIIRGTTTNVGRQWGQEA